MEVLWIPAGAMTLVFALVVVGDRHLHHPHQRLLHLHPRLLLQHDPAAIHRL